MNVKHGFSTLNRLLGKKNKGHNLSKSTTNLSKTSSGIEVSTGLTNNLEQNRITPLPAATSNAPFEQTFRITVLLPRDQLYVARLGARIKLEKLLQLICENKQLDPDKYEFRHPIDISQVFSLELTIGAVGLTEIRLCHKTEAYDNFNADEIIKLRHHTSCRESLSSSEFSSRNSKQTLKTTSPYSSSNSLNSIDSTGMNTSYRGPIASLPPNLTINTGNNVQRLERNSTIFPAVPTRKKRIAPRPPSQNSVPENEPIKTQANDYNNYIVQLRQNSQSKKDFHVSSPNLSQFSTEKTISQLERNIYHKSNLSIDCNGNNNLKSKINDKPNGNVYCYASVGNLNSEHKILQTNGFNENIEEIIDVKVARSLSAIGGSLSSISSASSSIPGQASPKKKAPAPPPRTTQPTPAPRTQSICMDNAKNQENNLNDNSCEVHITNGNCIIENVIFDEKLNHTCKEDYSEEKTDSIDENMNKTILNNIIDQNLSLQSDDSNLKTESSLEEEEHTEISNLNTSKISTKPISNHAGSENIENELNTTHSNSVENSFSSELPNWKFTIPAPPNFADTCPNDNNALIKSIETVELSNTLAVEEESIMNIKEIIKPEESQNFSETGIVNALDIENGCNKGTKETKNELIVDNSIVNSIPLNSTENFNSNKSDIISELNNIINQNGVKSVIRKPDDTDAIESIKPNILNNFKIISYCSENNRIETTENGISGSITKDDIDIDNNEDITFKKAYTTKRSSLTLNGNVASQLFRSKATITRADSFHSTQHNSNDIFNENNINNRSSSFVSLNHITNYEYDFEEKSKYSNKCRRKSSGELSIIESPSLQSLSVIKSILSNSRNNSFKIETNNSNGIPIVRSKSCLLKNNINNDKNNVRTLDCDNFKNISPKNNIVVSQNNKNINDNKNNMKSEQKWKYQGPPSISLSTWNERPKVHVSIKDDSDYKFGGGTNTIKINSVNNNMNSINTLPRNNKIYQHDNNKFIKKLNDISHKPNIIEKNVNPKIPFVRSVEYKKMNCPGMGLDKNYEEQNSIMTLGRIPKINRNSFVPVVRGFKNITTNKHIENNSELNDLKTPETNILYNNNNPNNKIDNVYESKISITHINPKNNENYINNKVLMKNALNEKSKNDNYFTQIKLKQTGFKDEIYKSSHNDNKLYSKNNENCTKITINHHENTNNVKIENLEFQPPPPIIRSVVTKPNCLNKSACIPDTRDQLLFAIRNFNKNSLKRA